MISINNVTKEFTKNKIKIIADNNISFTANNGEIVGILGPNGAGKTTLLRMIAGIMKPTSGSIAINKLNYDNDELEIKKQIAFLSGNTKLYKDISPHELLKMCGEYYQIKNTELNNRITSITKKLNMEKFLHQKIETLSTGQTQKVNIARCFLHNPNYYILDEATSGLDIISSEIILNFIKQERDNGKCILYSTHYMEEAENICDKVILIHKGKIIKTGTPKEIIKDTKTTNLRDAFFVLIGGKTNE